MTKFNYCPMCGTSVSHSDIYCKVCDYVLDRKAISAQRNLLKSIIACRGLYVSLPAPIKEMSNAQICEVLALQQMVEADMNTSADYNPDGDIDYHKH